MTIRERKVMDSALGEHPARGALLKLLRRDGIVTATGVAREHGGSSGLYSFHLRRLADHGIVEEAPGGRGRARPWRLAGTAGSAAPGDHPPQAAVGADFGHLARRLEDESYQRWLDRRETVPERWRRDKVFSQVIYLTPEDMAGVANVIRALTAQYRHREDKPSARPRGTAPVAVVSRLFPLLEAGS